MMKVTRMGNDPESKGDEGPGARIPGERSVRLSRS